jgi:hypothetical protein
LYWFIIIHGTGILPWQLGSLPLCRGLLEGESEGIGLVVAAVVATSVELWGLAVSLWLWIGKKVGRQNDLFSNQQISNQKQQHIKAW